MMIRETPQCAGPDDVREEFRRRVPLPSRAMIVENQRQYKRIQQQLRDYYLSIGEYKLSVAPPCTGCPVDVFHYCETTGTECKQFRLYAGGNKGEATDDND